MNRQYYGALIHLVGFLTGLLLFLILLTLVMRNQRAGLASLASLARGARGTGGTSGKGQLQTPQPLLLPAALIGVIWNFGALIIYGARDWGIGTSPVLFEGAVYSALGFLPAVVVHSALSSEAGLSLRRGARWMIGLAYGVSLVAMVLHFREALIGQEPPSVKALETLTIGFGILTVALVIYARRSSVRKRMFWLVALSVYAVSALHLSRHLTGSGAGEEPLLVELIGHHSSLPLVWAMLYRDYRFALADIFLKRVLAVSLLLVTVLGLSTLLVGPYLRIAELRSFLPLPVGGGLVLIWVAVTLAYPRLRRSVDWLVDAVILRREDYHQLKEDLARIAEESEDIDQILDGVCGRLRQAFTAGAVWWEADGDGREKRVDPPGLLQTEGGGSRTTIFLPTHEEPYYRLVIGELSSGRRFLSDDLALLESVALILARRLDTVRVIHERYVGSLREQEMSKLATEAELRALRAQLNPHFLFNALTTIGYLIKAEPERAVDTLMKLTGVLRAVLRAPSGELVPLGDEIELIESYLAVERARFEERLQVRIDVPRELLRQRIPALLLQPLVENAIKHGITPSLRGGEIRILAAIEKVNGGRAGEWLRLEVVDTGVGVDAVDGRIEDSRIRDGHPGESGHSGESDQVRVGLANVRKRLHGIYGDAASWNFSSRRGQGTSVRMWLPITGEGGRP